MVDQLAPSERHSFIHQGRKVYEWDQTLTEVNIYVTLPEGVRARELFVELSSNHLRLGIKPNPPYLDKDFGGRVIAGDSLWTVEGGVLSIQLCKLEKGEPWKSALAGHEINQIEIENEKKRLMLERFQEEHPGFDFSGAEFNGNVPNPRTFMKDVNDDR